MPTPIQAQTIPILNSDNDLAAMAQTGTGKLLPGLPVLHKMDQRQRGFRQ